MTGWNPGRHGIFDFRSLAIERYARLWGAGHSAAFSEGREFHTSRRWAHGAFWDLLGAETRVAVLGVPMTFPAWEVNGILVPGFPLPNYDRNHAHPPGAADAHPPLLQGADRLRRLSDEELADHCLELIDRQRSLVLECVEGDFDVVVAVFQSTDFAQHRLWRYLDEPGHPLREKLLEMYRRIDAVVGVGRERLGDQGVVAVVSDHGFGPHPRTLVRVDAMLETAGLLRRTSTGAAPGGTLSSRVLARVPAVRRVLRLGLDRLPRRLTDYLAGAYTGANQIAWRETRAYRLPLYAPAEGVVVNLRGRQAEGIVEPGAEYEQTRDAIIAAAVSLRDPDSGDPVVAWARRREDVFSGPFVEEAPDVIMLFDERFKGSAGFGAIFAPVPSSILESYSGVHAMDGIFAAAGPGVTGGDLGVRELVDVIPTLLALAGVPIPADIDGAPMEEALFEPAVRRGAERSVAPGGANGAPELTDEEARTVEESLRALGYLE